MQQDNNKIDVALLGKITLARFLILPLRAFDRLVTEIESSTAFSALRPWMTVGRLAGAQVAHDADAPFPTQAAAVLGEVHETDQRLIFVYQCNSYAREYRFDEDGVNHLISQPDFTSELADVLLRLRLINTRNRLTHALMQVVLTSQAAYLRSGQPLMLAPLTQAAISVQLRAVSTLAVVADTSRISRLVRGLSIALPHKKEARLSTLLTKPRQVYRHFVDHLIKKETAWMLQGLLQEPLTDELIAATLKRDYAIGLSRRTVANIRHDLAIPGCRNRSLHMYYIAATEGFSALVPLTMQMLQASIPTHSGVYEIRIAHTSRPSEEIDGGTEKTMQPGQHSVLYIGSAANLRKRLGDHLRGHSNNSLLYQHIAGGTVGVRFQLVSHGWRLVERDLYRVFCETFGVPPPCNRMSP